MLQYATFIDRLLALRGGQLPHYAAVTRAQTKLTTAELTELQQRLVDIGGQLACGDDDALRNTLARLRGDTEASPAGANPGASAVDATAHLSLEMLGSFVGSSATPFSAHASAASPPPESTAPHSDIGATSLVSPAEIAAAIQGLPAGASLPMSLQDYARLVANTEERGPCFAKQGRKRCHLEHNVSDEAHRMAIDATFHQHFQHNKSDWTEYTVALNDWRRWLKGER